MAAKRTTKEAKPATKAAKPRRDRQLKFESVADMRTFLEAESVKDGSHRMVPRAKAAAPADVKKTEESNDPSEGRWGPKPSVKRQLVEHPGSVRAGATVTRQFVLSDPDDLKAWNTIQARMHPPDSPEVRLGTYESQFSPTISSFVLHVSYAELEYQQLI